MADDSVVERALEAWTECQPTGYVVEAPQLLERLSTVAAHARRHRASFAVEAPPRAGGGGASGSRSGAAVAGAAADATGTEGDDAVDRLFAPGDDGGSPVFVRMLKVQDDKVHFLYFWRAFSEASRLQAAVTSCGAGAPEASADASSDAVGGGSGRSAATTAAAAGRKASPSPPPSAPPLSDGLTAELEGLRDCVLRAYEDSASRGDAAASAGNGGEKPSFVDVRLSADLLMEELHRAASMSGFPRFWQTAAETLAASLDSLSEDSGGLCLDDVASVLLSWLHDAAAFEAQRLGEAQAAAEKRSGSSSRPSSAASTASKEKKGLQVRLHIYDVSQEEGIQKLNRILAHKRSPLKLGGVFHAGVEVNGLEWSFGFSDSETRPGISCVEPKTHPQHHYRQTVSLPRTRVPAEEIADIITVLIEEYPGDDYDLLRRNCCHFADDFCKRLGVGGIPGWVHRLARIGAGVDTMLQAAPSSIRERIYNIVP